MLRFVSRFGRPAVALGIALLLLQGADAQPGGKGKRKGGDDAAPKADAQTSSELQAWIKTLTEKMTDRQDSIRDSARSALVSIGRPALPELQKLVDGKDSAAAEAAKQVIARIERGGAGGALAVVAAASAVARAFPAAPAAAGAAAFGRGAAAGVVRATARLAWGWEPLTAPCAISI